jgi:hypothetical protein
VIGQETANDEEARPEVRLSAVQFRCVILPVVAQRLDNRQHLLERDEAASMEQLVLVDRSGQFAGLGRKIVVRVGELPTLANGHLLYGRGIATFDKWDW